MHGWSMQVSDFRAQKIKSDKYYSGRTHDVQNCTRETVELVQSIYQKDLDILGYSLDDAYHACETYGLSRAPEL